MTVKVRAQGQTERAEAPEATFASSREFWTLTCYALVLGVFGAAFGLVFMGVVNLGGSWYSDSDPDWMGGHWWWVAVTAAAGLAVGVLRIVTKLPEKTPGLIADLQEEFVDPRLVSGIVIVSAASLAGGASLGPEKALGTAGGGLGRWMSRKGTLDREDRQVATLSGFAGAYGGLFSSTVIVVMLITEIVRPGGRKFTKVFLSTVVASSVSFGLYFAVAGSVFLDVYPVPPYEFKPWHLLASLGIGLLSTVVIAVLGLTVKLCTVLFARVKLSSLVKTVIGGIVFGLVGVALPLTMFTGSDQLDVVLRDGSKFGIGLVIVLVIAKMFTFGVSMASGFVGGPIFPALFVGGSAGVALHLAIPGLPLGLTFACMLAAVPGGLVAAPFTFVLLAAFMTQVGPLNSAPLLLAVITARLGTEGVKLALAARRSRTTAASPA